MAIKELEELAFVFQVGQLVLHIAKSIIKDENLLGSNGTFAIDGHTSRDIRHHQTLGFYTIDDNGVEGFFGDTASLEDFEEVSKYMSENIEIIGNIYENKDILEGINEKRK